MKNPVIKETLSWVIHIAIAVAIGLIIVNFVIQRTIVDGQSMEPTLQNADNLWVEKLTPKFGKLKYGDIVTIDVPEKVGEERSPLIKRVIGVEGDSIEIRNGKVYLNNKELNENYIGDNITAPDYEKITVPKDCVYVLGDNRENSRDSREIGPVEIKKISGKAIFRFLPLNKFGPIKSK
ncbi:MAG: signal peptidase I [Clostridia bacterium]|nr:signal peptidase I [Clostridia bacterium]